MRDGTMTGCIVRDRTIYSEQYKLGRRFALDRLRDQARRCRDCEFATCTEGCPAAVDVPAFIKAFADGDIAASYNVLRASNVLPEMCAFVCPVEEQCQGGCLEEILNECSLPIGDIQLVVSRLARAQGLTGVRLPSQKSQHRVAVVGGGPAGLACAIRLLEKGHVVTLFEKSDRLGGTPESIIPGARYESASAEIDAILAPAVSAGRIDVRFGQTLGENVYLENLRKRYSAVFLGMGLGKSTSLGKADGVVDALAFLQDVKRGKRTSVPQRVAVLGAGNTAIDAAVTAKGLGARDVFVIYRRSFAEMPAWPNERDRLLKSGGHVLILSQPVGYETDKKGKLTGLRIARTELGEPDESGRRAPTVVPGSESLMAIDLVVEAMGQGIPADLREALGSLTLSRHGLVATQSDSQATSTPRVFAGGDLVNGGTTAVRGIVEGMRAAEEIDRLLAGGVVVGG
jgi:glutamate synthase (NADPH/NADH) small chain